MIAAGEVLSGRPGKQMFNASERLYSVVEVDGERLEDIFFQIPERLYKNDPDWIPMVRNDVASVFDRLKNPYFNHGEAIRWVLMNNAGEACGRIAAFINFEKQFDNGKKIGCIGFFECVNDRDAAAVLFDTAAKWLTEHHGVDAIDGPVNFGENDKYWGLLISGFGPVSFGMNYNPPYYRSLFEDYGFTVLYKQITNYVSLSQPLPERFSRIAGRIISSGRYTFRPFRYKERKRYVRDFMHIYNHAWASFNNFHPIDEAVVEKSLAEMRPIMEEDFIWFAYADGEPVGLLVAVPDVNEIIRHAGAKFDWWGKLKFLFYRYVKGFTSVRVIIMGVVPEFQKHGLESALIFHAYNEGLKRPAYRHVQLAWVGDFNEKMIAIHKAMNAIEYKQHATLRKIL